MGAKDCRVASAGASSTGASSAWRQRSQGDSVESGFLCWETADSVVRLPVLGAAVDGLPVLKLTFVGLPVLGLIVSRRVLTIGTWAQENRVAAA